MNKNLIVKIGDILTAPFGILVGRSDFSEKIFFRGIVRSLTKHGTNSIRYLSFPKNIDCLCKPNCHYVFKNQEACSVVFQGPILDKKYIADTISLYKYWYPKVSIIVSTWCGEIDQELASFLAGYEVNVVESEIPLNPGPFNVNLQLESTEAGIDRAISIGAQYVLKHRTDIRFYNPSFLIYYLNMVSSWPPLDDRRKSRLCFLSDGSRLNTPFYLNDFVVFGHSSEMKKLYGIERNTNEKNYESDSLSKFFKYIDEVEFDNSIQDLSVDMPEYNEIWNNIESPEVYIAKRYFHENIKEITKEMNLLYEYHEFLRKNAIIVSDLSLLMQWEKNIYYKHLGRYIKNERNLTHESWISLMNDFDTKNVWGGV